MARFYKHKGSVPISTYVSPNFAAMNKALAIKQQKTDKVKNLVKGLEKTSLKGDYLPYLQTLGVRTKDAEVYTKTINEFESGKGDILKLMQESDGNNEDEITNKIFALKAKKQNIEGGLFKYLSNTKSQYEAAVKSIDSNKKYFADEKDFEKRKLEQQFINLGQTVREDGSFGGYGTFNASARYNPSKLVNANASKIKANKTSWASITNDPEFEGYIRTTKGSTKSIEGDRVAISTLHYFKNSKEIQNEIKYRVEVKLDKYKNYFYANGMEDKDGNIIKDKDKIDEAIKNMKKTEYAALDMNSYRGEDGKFDMSKVNPNTSAGSLIYQAVTNTAHKEVDISKSNKANKWIDFEGGGGDFRHKVVQTRVDRSNAVNDAGQSEQALLTEYNKSKATINTLKAQLKDIDTSTNSGKADAQMLQDKIDNLITQNARITQVVTGGELDLGIDRIEYINEFVNTVSPAKIRKMYKYSDNISDADVKKKFSAEVANLMDGKTFEEGLDAVSKLGAEIRGDKSETGISSNNRVITPAISSDGKNTSIYAKWYKKINSKQSKKLYNVYNTEYDLITGGGVIGNITKNFEKAMIGGSKLYIVDAYNTATGNQEVYKSKQGDKATLSLGDNAELAFSIATPVYRGKHLINGYKTTVVKATIDNDEEHQVAKQFLADGVYNNNPRALSYGRILITKSKHKDELKYIKSLKDDETITLKGSAEMPDGSTVVKDITYKKTTKGGLDYFERLDANMNPVLEATITGKQYVRPGSINAMLLDFNQYTGESEKEESKLKTK